MLTRRTLAKLCICTGALQAIGARAEEAPDALILRMSNGVLDAVRADPAIQEGDLRKVLLLVDELVMPNVNFLGRITALALGRHSGRQVTAEQQQRLEAEFKMLLIRSYAGALTQVRTRPCSSSRCGPSPAARRWSCAPRSWARGRRSTTTGSRGRPGPGRSTTSTCSAAYGFDNYRSSFAQEISASGIDGLIAKLAERNRAAAVGH